MSASVLVDGLGAWAISKQISEKKENVIGRAAECDIRLSDPLVSNRHACIISTPDGWQVRDLGSRNGITVNEKRVESAILRNTDIIQVGNTSIVFKCKTAGPPEPIIHATQTAINVHQAELQAAIRGAEANQPVRVPDFNLAKEPVAAGGGQSDDEPGFETFSYETERGPYPAVPEVKETELSSGDRLWIAERLTDLMAQLALIGTKSKTEVFTAVLTKLQEIIRADNGFLMIPNREERRWVIKAWVGDSDEWTEFGKSQPIPLTIANKAFKLKEVISNAVDGLPGAPESASLFALKVNHYIAVPLLRNGKRQGLLYFDTRNPFGTFQLRHVKLLERAGAYLVDIDQRLEEE